MIHVECLILQHYDHFYSVPSLIVDVQHDGGTPIYAGNMLTLTCNIFLVSIPSNLRDGVTVTTSWLAASGNQLNNGDTITVNPAMGIIDTVYISTVVFHTVRTNNAGTYTCQATATHSSQFITDVTTPGEVTILPIGECNKVYSFEDIITVLSSKHRVSAHLVFIPVLHNTMQYTNWPCRG